VADPKQWKETARVEGFQERSFTAAHINTDDIVFDFDNRQVRPSEWMKADHTEIAKSPIVARHVMVQVTALGRNNDTLISIYEIQIAARPH
jgi:hypothetical protein